MKFFDYKEIYLAAGGNPSLMLDYYRSSNLGKDWIKNPKVLADFWVSDRHKAEYLGFCALRPYVDYVNYGKVDIAIVDLPPWVPLKLAEENPYLAVTDTHIKFIKET